MAVNDLTFGGNTGLNSSFLQPTQGKNLYPGNYLDFTSSTHQQWAQQFLPDVYDKEIEIYGNRTISGFLKMVSAEMPSSSDQIIWLEQGRLHTRYTGLFRVATAPTATATNATASTALTAVVAGTAINFQLNTASQRGPGAAQGNLTNTNEGSGDCNFRTGQTVMIQREDPGTTGDTSRGTGDVIKGIITGVTARGFTVSPYQALTAFGGGTASTYTALVYGSEFAKGTGNFTEKIDPSYSTYQNSPIIMKEHYAINGSDTGQIGWIEVTSENGASGYLWYVKAEHENRLRWEDYQEMAMLEAVPNDQTGTAGTQLQAFRGDRRTDASPVSQAPSQARGTQGFFDALYERGNVYGDLSTDLFTAGAAAPTATGIVALQSTFDVILKQMDKQGAIEENMMYVNRDLTLSLDNFIATQNNYGGVAGVSWGVFNSSSDTAVNLGFSGFRRGSYDFYKSDWKYLNDYSTRGGFGDIEGVMIPAGTSTVYDQNLGKNIKRPFLHIRYRASETDNRKMKSWITGSVGGAYTTDIDEMRMHYLTEKCLITQGANNFYLFEK